MRRSGEELSMRIDRVISNMGFGSRSDIKKDAKKGLITVNGEVISSSSIHVNPYEDEIIYDGEKVFYREFVYLMMNKPDGYLSATDDFRQETVVDLLDDDYRMFRPFPVGRLDKDSVGLLILTNDGEMAHRVTSPKKKVPKKYFVRVEGELTQDDIDKFKEGMDLGDFQTKTAELEILRVFDIQDEEVDECYPDEMTYNTLALQRGECRIYSEAMVTIMEGKYHQVKRMFEKVGKKVAYLRRTAIGELELDKSLGCGGYRELTEEEIKMLAGDDYEMKI